MNDLILQLATALFENKECINKNISFVTNYKKHFEPYFNKSALNKKWFDKIKEILFTEKVDSFNLTIEFESGRPKMLDSKDTSFSIGWYRCQFIFHGKTEINVVFDSLSDYCGLGQSDFNRFIGFRETEDNGVVVKNIPETIQNLVDLKNILIENGYKTIAQLSKIKDSNK